MILTNEQKTQRFEQLDEFISKHKSDKGPLMPIMQKAQELFGFLGIETQLFISEKMNIPMVDVYGVATFYSQFSLKQKGEYIVSVCLGTACYVKNAQDIMDALEVELDIKESETTENGMFTLEATRCLGCCGLAPVIMINDDVYGRLNPEDVPAIIQKYIDKK